MKPVAKFSVVLSLLLLVAGLGSYSLYRYYHGFLDTPLTIPEPGIELNVPQGASIQTVARDLAAQGRLDSPGLLEVYARFAGLAPHIKAGEYRLTPATTPRQLLEQLVAGRVMQFTLTVVEGWTFRQLLAAIARHDKLEHTLTGLDDAKIMARLGRLGQHPEGRFFPDTYHFPAGTTDVAFLKRALTTMESHLQRAWAERSADLPLTTPYEALILASIVEKETAVAEEYRKVAGVFTRRLHKGMLLQADPTVIYGMGVAFKGDIRRRDLRADTPYNTYVHRGLPPTPIALPGAGAIAAAVNPAPGDALYFVATGDGRHVFSATLREHNRAVRKYQLGQQN